MAVSAVGALQEFFTAAGSNYPAPSCRAQAGRSQRRGPAMRKATLPDAASVDPDKKHEIAQSNFHLA
jgi:hypothetical protein